MIQIIAVRFKESKIYNSREFFYKTELPVQVGDEVIVNVSKDRVDLELALVTRTEVDFASPLSHNDIDYVVQLVDTRKYIDRRKRTENVRELKRQLDIQAKDKREQALYNYLAKEDDDFRELYLEYLQEIEGLLD